MIKNFTRLFLWLLFGCHLLLLHNSPLKASAVPENQLKAAYLIHLSEFTTWPPEKTEEPSFFICLASGSNLSQPLEEIKNHPVKDKQLNILYDVTLDKLNLCHVLYVEEGNEKAFLESLAKNDAILTVSSKQDFIKAGGIIEYYRNKGEDKIKMRVNLKMLSQQKLTISSKLLRLMDSDF
jgi:hypothetical protein